MQHKCTTVNVFILKCVYMRLPCMWAALLNVLDKSGQVSYYHSHHCFGTGFSRKKIAFILESWFIGSMKPEDRRMPESTIGGPRKVVRKDGGEGNCYKTPHTIFPGCLLRHDRYLFPSVAR
jgi:hypothetical protein